MPHSTFVNENPEEQQVRSRGAGKRQRLRAGSGSILATYTFPPEFERLDADLDYASFMFSINAPTGTRLIELLHADQVLAT